MLRLAIAQVRPRKADYAENLRRLGAVFARAAQLEPPPTLVVGPETITSGYFVEGGVREVAVTAGTLFEDLLARHEASGAPPLDVALGFYEEWRNRFYNSALYATLGGAGSGIRHVHRKVFLPTYGVFDEERFVERGHDVRAFDTAWGRAAFLICEDAWHSITPTLAALDGAQLLIIPSASPARGAHPLADGAREDEAGAQPINVQRWERIIRDMAEEHGVFVALAQLLGFEGGKAFLGGSAVVSPGGEVLVRGPLFEQALVVADLDLRDITRARADQPLLADLETAWPHLVGRVAARADGAAQPQAVEFDAARPREQEPPVGATRPPALDIIVVAPDRARDPLAMDPTLVRRWLVEFLKDEVILRRGYRQGLVGLSGGVDSSLTAHLAVEALGAENVVGVCMPYRTSSPEAREHAVLVAKRLGIQCVTVNITDAVDGYLERYEPDADGTRRGNVMARQRMIVLFDLSAKLKALPLGTGNKSERLLGYFTWHADDSPPVNPLGDLFKTQVWALARHVGVPEEIVAKPATADLIRGQTDEGDLGISYTRADRILSWLLRGVPPEEIVRRGFTGEEVALVRDRLETTHWKRRLPTVAMLSQTAIGEYYLRPVDY